MGWAQIPDVIIQPEEEEGKNYLENARSYDPSVKGVLGSVLLALSIGVFLYLLSTSYLYLGILVIVLVSVFFGWTIIRNQTPLNPGKRSKL
jgi:hypothetical protein